MGSTPPRPRQWTAETHAPLDSESCHKARSVALSSSVFGKSLHQVSRFRHFHLKTVTKVPDRAYRVVTYPSVPEGVQPA